MFRYSLANYVAASGLSATSASSTYPVTNLAAPWQPGNPWRSTSRAGQRIVVDCGAALPIGCVGVFRTNFREVRLEAHASNPSLSDFSALEYSVTRTVTRNPHNRRYQHLHAPIDANQEVTKRYVAVTIPGLQDTVGGEDYYLIGGIWVGLLTDGPWDIEGGYRAVGIFPKADVRAQHLGSRGRVQLSERICLITADRRARTGDPHFAGLADEYRAWTDVDAAMQDAGRALVQWESGDPSQAAVVQIVDDVAWRVGGEGSDVAQATTQVAYEEIAV